MEKLKLRFKNSFFSRPLKVYGTTMQPNLLLMCKIFVLLLYVHGFFSNISDPYIPFIPFLDSFNEIPFVFEYIIKTIFIVASLLLFFNIKVRTMAVAIGMVVIVSILGSKSLFKNHLFIIGCMLFLSGLSEKNQKPWLFYLQLSLVYFGALLNKIWQLDWWTGQFMHYWLSESLNNSIYNYVSEYLPERLFAKIISYSAMVSELVIAICLLIPKLRFYGVTLVLVFHTLLFTFTGETFGFFMEDVLIILLAFLVWPKAKVLFSFKSAKLSTFFRAINLLDWDSRIKLHHNAQLNTNFELNSENRIFKNFNAITHLLIYSPGFFMVLVFIEIFIRLAFNGKFEYVLMLLLFWSILWLLRPLANNRGQLSSEV